jgi:hypothetical protein
MAFTQVDITQDYTLADGTEPSGSVTFTPTAPMFNGSVVVPMTPAVARLAGGTGTINLTLVANTDPATAPAGAAYKVDEVINGVKRTYHVQVPHNLGSSLTLYSLAQVATAPAISFPMGAAPYTDEQVRDVMAAALVAGANVTITPNDGADTITVAAPVAGYTDEQVRDVMGVALVAGANVTITPNDGADTITIAAASASGISPATVDAKGDLIVGTANDTVARHAVGSDGQALLANSAVTNGVSWGAPAPAAHNHAASEVTSGTVAAARLGSGTANSTTYLRGDQTYADPTLQPPVVHAVGNSGAALTIDASATGYVKTITLNANCTFTLSGATSGRATSLELVLTQDGTGSRTVTWPAAVKWAGGAPTLSTAAGSVDRIVLVTYNAGTTWYADLVGKGYA